MNKDIFIKTTLGEIVVNDFRAAAIFKQAGIDFCCGGNLSLGEACSDKSIDSDSLIEKLGKLADEPQNPAQNYKDWEPGFLIDYIVNIHHKYVLKTLPELMFYTNKIAEVHGSHHPELVEVAALFALVNNELLQHLKKEEEIVFPAIKQYYSTTPAESKEKLLAELPSLLKEHEEAGGAMDKINVITNNYALPADACNTYHVAFKLLEEFEDDLHIHVHLENNILLKNLQKSIQK